MFKTNFFKQTVFVVLVTILALSACKKNDDAVITPSQPLILTEFSDGNDVTKFDYNADGSLKTIQLKNDPISHDDNVKYTIKYSANKKIDELNGSNGSKIKVTYNNNLITKAEAFDGQLKISETVYEYNNSVLKSTSISLVNNNIVTPFFKSELIFNSIGNATRSNVAIFNPFTNKLEAAGHVINQYDSKINPFTSINDVILIFWQQASKNNVIKQEYFNKNGTAEEVVETSYSYNVLGYPTRGTIKETQPGQQPTTAIISFLYK